MAIRKPDRRQPASRRRTSVDPTLWTRLARIGERIPDRDLKKFPKDGAEHAHHYVDGAPRGR